jgi:AcrR family transcriptional regulator
VASVYREPVPELAAVLSGPTDAPDTPSLSDVEEFFEQLISCLDEGVRTSGEFRCELGYAVRVRSWNLVSRAAPDAIETREPEPSWLPPKEPELLLAGPFSAMLTLFRTASARILDILRAAGGPQDSVVRAVETAVPTYGIYAPPTSPSSDAALHDWAIERGIPPQLTLSGAPRILLCLSAQDRFVDSLIEAGDVADPTALARSFQRTVLVHEHFHAAVETSLDDGGDLPVGPADATAWQRGMPLNEALATWSELHLARADEPLSRAIWEYVRSGPYPEWPYRGAEGVERRFADEGVDGVRRLIAALRTDPAGAAADFEVRA